MAGGELGEVEVCPGQGVCEGSRKYERHVNECEGKGEGKDRGVRGEAVGDLPLGATRMERI